MEDEWAPSILFQFHQWKIKYESRKINFCHFISRVGYFFKKALWHLFIILTLSFNYFLVDKYYLEFI